MNLHLSQSIPAIAETKNIISTVENFNSSQDSKPMIGFKLDAMTSAYLITLGTVRVHKWLFDAICNQLEGERVSHKLNHIREVLSWKTDLSTLFNQLVQSNPELQQVESELQNQQSTLNTLESEYTNAKGKQIATLYKQVEKQRKQVQSLQQRKHSILETYQLSILDELLYTGHNLISILLPDDFEYEIQNNASPDGKPVSIIRGVLLSGTLDKKAMGSSSGSLIHHLSKDYNNQRAIQFVSEFSRMMNQWLYQQGFTVGIYDCMAHNTDVIEEEINKNLLKAKASIQSETDPELREMSIKIALNDTASIGRKVAAEALKPDNKIKKIVKSGSKGNDFNITQITGLVGQQNVSGNRIEKQFGGRTLPHFEFEIDDIRTEFMSRGFVFSSYFKGMNPMETFFAAAGGREGLIDTAVKSVTGDTSIIVYHNGSILQTTIGEWIDGQLDTESAKNKIQHFDEMNMEYLEIEERKTYIPTCDAKGKTSWGEVVAITRHDPGTELFEIKTQSGREVIVTASKSLVIWNEEKEEFVPTLMKDVKVGDYVPVTMELSQPPIIKTYVDMSTYLPKTEYVYGTDFNMAIESMDSVMNSELTDGAKKHLKLKGKEGQERTAVPKGWWAKNNGSTFTLPYPSKARLQRATVRSNIADIKFGYVYPFGGVRQDHLIPDKFELNYENGVFIGLFLADGNVEISKKAEVRITKNNKEVQEFVTRWFKKHNIHSFIETKTVEKTETHPGGTSTMIRGNCSVLAQFLLKFVGHTSYNKFVPNEAFTAPLEFIRGLVGGYFSGDGTIDKEGYSINAATVSKKLAEGINYCLNRLGIFCRLTKRKQKSNNIGTENIAPIYEIDIRSQWASIFKHQIKLIEPNKQARLDALDPTEEHRNYPYINNVVYDTIVGINKVGVEKYPKVYDLTIPSTFLFSCGSGLIINDTADTGYLQRRMEKILEDLTASYIGTVNDANYNVIQFNYGEDNFDASKCISVGSKGGKQVYSFVDLKHIVIKYNTGLEWKLRKTGVSNKKRKFTQEEIQKIKEDIIRGTYITFYHKHTTDEVVDNSFSTLEPAIYQVEVYPEVIQDIYKEISRQLKLTIVNPGESVGHIAASSIGEKNTQSTLNSFHASGQLKKNLTYGIVRLQELMNATHNPKTRSLTIYFNQSKLDTTNLSLIRQIANTCLLSHTLSDFIINYKIEKNPQSTKLEQNWYYIYKALVANDDTTSCSYRLRLYIKTDLLFLTKRTLRQICKQLEMILIKNVHFYVICSPDSLGIIDIWIEDNVSEPSTFFNAKGMEDDLLLDNFINKNNKMVHLIKKIILPKLKKCHISGIEGITECYYDQTKQDEWFVQTRGGSLKCLLFHPLIDHRRTYTNDMWEIYDLFGVECAKKWLKDEFSQMLDVNHRHLDVLVDKVTFNGSISSVNIYGLDRKVIGPLSKAVFERPLACLLTAAQKAELDRLTSIGACIATGKIGRFGTGMVDVILDNESVITNEYASKQYDTSMTDASELAPLPEDEEEGLTVEEAIDLNEDDIY